MAVTIRRANASNIPANTRTRLYTVPAGKVAILRTLTQGNDNGFAVRMGAEVNGAGWLWYPTVAAGGARVWPLSSVLYEGQYVNVEHNNGASYSMLQYAEMDRATEGRNLWQLHHLSVNGTTASYVVPAGKRVRVREVIACPHDASNNFSSFISGIGHFWKGTITESTVLGTDMSVNAGETIGSTAGTASAFHMFYSGVIEDA